MVKDEDWCIQHETEVQFKVILKCPTAENVINPLVPEFIIPAEPLNSGDKMAAPGKYTKRAHMQLLVPSFGRNGSSMDFIVYSCVPEEL